MVETIHNLKPSLDHKRDPGLRYLELHNWNAKRMRMKPLWGWMLPYSPLQRDVGYFLKVLLIFFRIYPRIFESGLSSTTCPTSKCSLSKATLPRYSLFFPLWFPHFSHSDAQSRQPVRFQLHQTLPLFSSLDETPFRVGSIEVLMDSPSFCLLFAHPAVSDALSALLAQRADSSFPPFHGFE